MTDEDFFKGMFRVHHTKDCGYWTDQYWWECDCGAVTDEIRKEHEDRKKDKQ